MAQYLCIWVGAYWFSATSFSEWPPGGHIRFFGFWTLQLTRFPGCKSSLLWNFNFKLHMHVDGGHRQKPIDFQWGQIQNGRLVAILDFWSISQVCFGISISNFICMLMVAIGRSLLIFSDVAFKMAAWQPYWIFWFPDSNFSLALNINFKLQWHNTYVYG